MARIKAIPVHTQKPMVRLINGINVAKNMATPPTRKHGKYCQKSDGTFVVISISPIILNIVLNGLLATL